MCHRIHYVALQETVTEILKGMIEADETYAGGKGRGKIQRCY